MSLKLYICTPKIVLSCVTRSVCRQYCISSDESRVRVLVGRHCIFSLSHFCCFLYPISSFLYQLSCVVPLSTFLYTSPYSTPIVVCSLLSRYINPFGLYERSLQLAHARHYQPPATPPGPPPYPHLAALPHPARHPNPNRPHPAHSL